MSDKTDASKCPACKNKARRIACPVCNPETAPRTSLDERDHLRNILRRLKEEIRENKPVNAFEWVKTLEERLEMLGVLYD